MGCACQGAKAGIAYEVTYKDGRKERFASSTEAAQAVRNARGGTYKAVAAK